MSTPGDTQSQAYFVLFYTNCKQKEQTANNSFVFAISWLDAMLKKGQTSSVNHKNWPLADRYGWQEQRKRREA